MARKELNATSFDHEVLKQNLIDFLKSTNKFDDFNFEGSAINTIVDVLVRNGHYDAFLANMLSNESFLQSAQIRHNVVSHAEKLSYTAKSSTASRLICTIDVIPQSTSNVPTSIVLEPGTPFIGSVGGQTYTFTNTESYTLTYNSSLGRFRKSDIELYQGSLISNNLTHFENLSVTIPNSNCDTSTLKITELSQVTGNRPFQRATTITDLTADNAVYFLSENSFGLYEVSFGRDLLGSEPADGSTIRATYIATEEDHANGVTSLVPGSLVGGYGNIQIDVTTKSYGGSDKEDIERIRFIAPKYYQAQGRALTDTDYIPLLKAQYPFVRQAISWGGETNNPPVYGTVFISILSDQGGLITNAVKQQMETYLSDFNVGSVTPTITDPEQFGIDLSIAFSYDQRQTNQSFNDLSTKVKQVIDAYNSELFDFDQYYNEAELNSRLMDIQGVTSLDIDKKQFKIFNVLRFENPVYTIRFNNELKPGSVMMTDFAISNGHDHKLYDDKKGNLIVEYINISEQKVTKNVGTVNYDNGDIEFIINMIQPENQVTLYVETKEDNFYATQNKVVYINSIETSLLQVTTRVTESTINE